MKNRWNERSFVRATMSVALILTPLFSKASAHEITSGSVVILHPWVAATAPGSNKTNAYVIGIKNTSDSEERLVGATIEGAQPGIIRRKTPSTSIEGYTTVEGGLPIPPRGEAGLVPGQTQIYFEGLTRPLEEGQTVKGTLIFEKAGPVPLEYSIEPAKLASEDSPEAMTSNPDGDHSMHMNHMH
jgi:copper(I)-binding protein